MSTRELPPTLDATPAADDGAASFEALYERLEQVAQRLGAGGLSLEESVALYEEGMRLAARCEQLLDTVEQRVETLRNALVEGDPRVEEPPALDEPRAPEEPPPDEPLAFEPAFGEQAPLDELSP